MSYTISALKSDLEAALHGTNLNKVVGVNNLIQRAGSDLLLELDPMETIRIADLASPIYMNVYDYYLPVDLKGNKIIDIRPQANRTPLDRYTQSYNQDFSIGKDISRQPTFTIQYNTGYKTMRISNNLLDNGIQLSSASSITGGDSWVVGVDASNLQQDYLQFVDGQTSSLSFDISGSTGIATLTDTINVPLDCSGQNNQSQIFFFTYLPTASAFTTIQIKWGSSVSNYYTQTLNSTNVGTIFQDGWNLLEADWESAQIVGTPDNTKISYLQVTWNYTGSAQTSVRLNSIYSRLGTISEIEYYSKYLFRDANTGAFQETITDDSNIINLDTETRNLLFLLTGYHGVQQIQGLDAMFFDSQFFGEKYQEALQRYKAMYKSQVTKPKTQYYRQSVPGYRRWAGWRSW